LAVASGVEQLESCQMRMSHNMGMQRLLKQSAGNDFYGQNSYTADSFAPFLTTV
jgi:hypothetical protein